MSRDPTPSPRRRPATTYRLQVLERPPATLSSELDGFTVHAGPPTTLIGPLADTAALYGLIARLEALGLTLVSIERTDTDSTVPRTPDDHITRDDSNDDA
jgi:hypothetical protein